MSGRVPFDLFNREGERTAAPGVKRELASNIQLARFEGAGRDESDQGRVGKMPWVAIIQVTPRNGCMFSCAPPPPDAVVEPDPPPVTPGAVAALPGASDTLAAPAL